VAKDSGTSTPPTCPLERLGLRHEAEHEQHRRGADGKVHRLPAPPLLRDQRKPLAQRRSPHARRQRGGGKPQRERCDEQQAGEIRARDLHNGSILAADLCSSRP
jgi:hypothetical protein